MPSTAPVEFDYSQYGEQSIILAYFEMHPQPPRYCVDAGAFDGVTGSNSRALILQGWGGVVIEPDPRTFARLQSLYEDRTDVFCLQRALSDRVGLRRMQFCKGPPGTRREDEWQYAQVNTFSRRFAASYVADHNYRYRASLVLVTTLTRALKRAGAPREIGFMSIDCEMEDLAVIKGLDFACYRPHLLCVECDDASRKLYAGPLASCGYQYHAHTAANTLFRRAC